MIHELFAGRPGDIEDAIGVVRMKGSGMDWDYVDQWVRQFAEIPGREDLPARLEVLHRRWCRCSAASVTTPFALGDDGVNVAEKL